MMWQDMVFLIGSMTSVMFLYPTLRDTASRVPRATSIPSMVIGAAYSMTFLSLGMTFSAAGSFAACTMWSLIAAFRAPDDSSLIDSVRIPGRGNRGTGLWTRLSKLSRGLNSERSTDEARSSELVNTLSSEDVGSEPTDVFESDLDAPANSD